MTKDSEITKVQIVIRRFLWETKDIVKDPAESQRWLSKFRNTLEFQDLEELPSKYALLLLAEAKSFNNTKKRNAQMKWVRESLEKEGFKKPTQEQLDERWIEMYGQDELTAGAPNGNAGDESATACENMRRVPQNEDPSHGFSGGDRPAQGSMSLPPSGAAHDGNNLGSAKATTPVSTPTISTSGPRQAENAQAEAGAPSHGGSVANNSALDSLDKASDQAASNTGNAKPVACRESGNLSEVTTKKPNGGGADAANRKTAEDCKSATSAQPLRPWKEVVEKSLGMTSNEKRPAGGSTPSSSSLVPPAGTVDVLSLAYSGEFQNVKLTQEQYAELGIRFGNQQKLNRAIDSLSCKLENEEIKPVPKNHYALLLKWASYREDMEEKKELEESKPKMTNMEKTWIAAMKRVEAM